MKPKNFIVIGGQDRGKSYFVKQLLKKSNLPLFAYDVNSEYSNKKFELSMEEFLQKAITLKNTKIVFEESTIFFSSRGREQDLIRLLVAHNGNLQFFCFHSLRSVPIYILELCHYLVLFKTKDNPTTIQRIFKNYDSIISLYNESQNSKINICSCGKKHEQGFHDHKILNLEM